MKLQLRQEQEPRSPCSAGVGGSGDADAPSSPFRYFASAKIEAIVTPIAVMLYASFFWSVAKATVVPSAQMPLTMMGSMKGILL